MNIWNFIKQFWRTEQLGLQLYIKDARELFFDEMFGSEPYTPKHQSWKLAPIFAQDQKRRQNCSFNAWADVLGVYFGEQVSVRWLTAKAYQQGWCAINGSTTMKTGARVAQKFGVVFEKDLPTDENISDTEYVAVDFSKFDQIAKQNKIGSFYIIRKVDDIFKAIDKGYAIAIGRNWLYSMTISGGFSAPWVIKREGKLIGGHATSCIGYWKGYQGQDVDIESNSYGTEFGDGGNFYCPIKDLENDIKEFGAFAVTEILYTPKDIKIGLIKKAIGLLKDILTKRAMENRDKLYNKAKNLIGQNLAPGNEKLGCAISMCAIYNRAFPELPPLRFVNTSQWLDWCLSRQDLWEEIFEIEPKCLLIYSTDEALKIGSPLEHGHIHLVGQFYSPDGSLYTISNNSLLGILDTHITVKGAKTYFETYGKLTPRIFRRIG